MSKVLLVFIGGGSGAASRYLITFLTDHFGLYVNLVPNIVGAFLVGVLASQYDIISKELWLLLVIGFLGGFTTFSGYIQFIATEGGLKSFYYILLHHLLGFGFFFLGFELSSRILLKKV